MGLVSAFLPVKAGSEETDSGLAGGGTSAMNDQAGGCGACAGVGDGVAERPLGGKNCVSDSAFIPLYPMSNGIGAEAARP